MFGCVNQTNQKRSGTFSRGKKGPNPLCRRREQFGQTDGRVDGRTDGLTWITFVERQARATTNIRGATGAGDDDDGRGHSAAELGKMFRTAKR